MDEAERPIVIKRIKKAAHAHHGGAWKVAFADFATAMMAFFLLLWLLSTASPEQKQAISGFFDAESEIGVGQGSGFSDSMIDLGGAENTPKGEGEDWNESSGSQSSQEIQEEARQMEELLEVLKEAIEEKEELKAYKDQLKLSVTPEGLRIQIVDKENRPMFESGKAVMREHATKILREIAPIISNVGNRISITGHTDAARFVGHAGYSNWELSADRANAARRALINAGMPEGKVGRVVGLADSSLYNPDNPKDPINRRISIVVMNKVTDEAIGKEEGALKIDSAEDLDLESSVPISNPLEGISQSLINDTNVLEGENIIVDTQKAPLPSAAPAIDGEQIQLPIISLPELNAAAERAVPTPPIAKAAPPASSSSFIKIDLGGGSVSTPKPASIVAPTHVKTAPPANSSSPIKIDFGSSVSAPKPTAPKPATSATLAPSKASPPVPPKKAVTPGAVTLTLPGL